MTKFVPRASRVDRAVEAYLRARGASKAELPPDMLRELTRLMQGGQMGPDEFEPIHASASSNDVGEDRRSLLSFEMYLAAWMATKQPRIPPPGDDAVEETRSLSKSPR